MSEDTGGKVEYYLSNGFTSTAYLDEMPEGREIFVGTDKHTDEPVTLQRIGDRYVQLSSQQDEDAERAAGERQDS